MSQQRLQFTIRGLIWATFWAALTAASFALIRRVPPNARPLALADVVGIFGCVVGPFVATGSLFGRGRWGLLLGGGLFLLAILGIAIAWVIVDVYLGRFVFTHA